MTSQSFPYTPPAYNPGTSPDLFYGGAALRDFSSSSDVRANEFRIRWQREGVVAWEIEFRTHSGGQRTQGDFYDVSDCIVEMIGVNRPECDTRWPGYLILSPLTVTYATPDPDVATQSIMSSSNIFGNLAIAAGDDANSSLFSPTSATDPTIVAKTYTPTSKITNLANIVIGGATAQRLIVMREGGAAQVLSDLASTPTVDGTMHAGTNPAWGMLQGFVNNDTILGYINGTISTTPKTAAIGDAWTAALSNVPNGGYNLKPGIFRLGAGPIRAWWVWPRNSNLTTSMLAADDRIGDIVSTNIEGTDPQILSVPTAFVRHALPYRGGIAFSDERSWWWHTGDSIYNLNWGAERVPDPDDNWRSMGAGVIDNELYVSSHKSSAVDDSGQNHLYEYFNHQRGTWNLIDLGTVNPIYRPASQLPNYIRPDARYGGSWLYVNSYGNWRLLKMVTTKVNPFLHLRPSTAPTWGIDYEYETSSAMRTAIMYLPNGLSSYPSIVSEIVFGGEMPATTNIDSSVEIEVAEQTATAMSFSGNLTATFNERDRWDTHYWVNPASEPSTWRKLQVQITLRQGTGAGATRITLNALPYVIRGYTFLNRKATVPFRSLEPDHFAGVG